MENSLMQRAKFMKEPGIKIRLMAKECIFTLMGQDMREHGLRIFNMGMEKNSGPMVQVLRASTVRERKMAWACTAGWMEQAIKESGKIMK